MTIEYDDKGKFYKDVISKSALPTIIQTATQRIHGSIHIRRDQRLKDELDINEKFLAVTDATVYTFDGQILYRCKFISIQRAQIVWVIPETELISPPSESGEK
ncbi:MAG: hypothetical protein Q7U34_07280 [Anaerolineales bacterium]|nr:hypothetical protein [Anaerolineales bacterium]MDP3183978.1 hypothetical protein [Anaerolineales bacterium]